MDDKDLLFNILGYVGSCMIGSMLIPQVYLTIKTKKTKDLSTGFLLMNMVAVSSMIPYSIYFNLIPVLIANSSVCICNSILLYYTLSNYYSEKKTIENANSNKNQTEEENTCYCNGVMVATEMIYNKDTGNVVI